MIERKVNLTKIVEEGFTAATSLSANITTLTSLTAEAVLAKSKYQTASAQTYAFAFGYILGVLNKVAIQYAKENK